MNEKDNRFTPSEFNFRFTQFVDHNVEGTSLAHKLQIIERKTGISQKNLRRYYVAKADIESPGVEFGRVINKERVHMPSRDTIDKLASFFNVSSDYLVGKRDIKMDVTPTLLSLLADDECNGNIALEEGLLQAKESKYWSSYKATLSWLLTETAGKQIKADTPEFLLLHSIGQYLFRPVFRERVTIPRDIVEDAKLLKKHNRLRPELADRFLESITREFAIETEEDCDTKYIEKIVEQLKAVRAEVRSAQEMALTAMKAYAEEHGGTISFVDGDLVPEVREAVDCGAYDRVYHEK